MNPNATEPTADAAAAYLEALHGRLAADGCTVTTPPWDGRRVVTGSRADRKARWFGTKAELFVFAAAVPEIDVATLGEFTAWAMRYAKSLRGGIPGARNAALVLPALVSTHVRPEAAQWAAQDARILDTTLISRPLTIETAPGAARTTMYRGRVVWGGMFTGHVLEKASLYFP
ncbi:hypothetical protein AQF52_0801 [Streptomyces venezuelae]|uniref:hypothetical protein n=1 Tax=Streptomyces gardneri TaxID=66892 RepID=UPI0006BD2F0B|nr:hypothetical protein [Streptomyces gardneri]ALO06398.1 hypothetical protein AQF52_0801 [Streptomyces venezuelae]QPK43843.1 hypothetical protein H4W23_03910 [Streptomyces gardneri]WRK35100.1 hypothetical protein U0M97_03925 [Streptomyces venezuelae]CUM43341.1 hypothetical protein BN2537_15647 [Streptomyces venezuelae]